MEKKENHRKGFFADFKAFINKGNVFNLAVAFIMGAAFTAIITSLVNDLIMPFISIIFGKNNIGDLSWVVSDDLTIHYGKFILAVVNFLLIALALFIMIKIIVGAQTKIEKLHHKKEAQDLTETPAETNITETQPPAESTESILKDILRTLLSKENK